ncbi:hypothetical protein ACXWRW_11675, partial [Streptococcus pyogenes]
MPLAALFLLSLSLPWSLPPPPFSPPPLLFPLLFFSPLFLLPSFFLFFSSLFFPLPLPSSSPPFFFPS